MPRAEGVLLLAPVPKSLPSSSDHTMLSLASWEHTVLVRPTCATDAPSRNREIRRHVSVWKTAHQPTVKANPHDHSSGSHARGTKKTRKVVCGYGEEGVGHAKCAGMSGGLCGSSVGEPPGAAPASPYLDASPPASMVRSRPRICLYPHEDCLQTGPELVNAPPRQGPRVQATAQPHFSCPPSDFPAPSRPLPIVPKALGRRANRITPLAQSPCRGWRRQ